MTSDGVIFLALNADKNHTATFALFVARRHTRDVSQHLCDLTGMSQARLVTPRTCCSGLVRYAGVSHRMHVTRRSCDMVCGYTRGIS